MKTYRVDLVGPNNQMVTGYFSALGVKSAILRAEFHYYGFRACSVSIYEEMNDESGGFYVNRWRAHLSPAPAAFNG